MNILRTCWPIPLVVLAAAAAAVIIVLISPWASERSAAEIVRDACVPDRLNGLDATLTVTRTTDAETKTRTYEYRMNNDAVHQVQYDADGNARREVFAFNDSRYYRREADSSGQWNAWEFRDTTNSQSSDLPVGSSDTFCGVENLVNIRDVGIEVVDGLSLRRYSAESNPDTLPDKWTETWDFWIDSNSRFVTGRHEAVREASTTVSTIKFHGVGEPNVIFMNLPPVFSEPAHVFSIGSLTGTTLVGSVSASDPEGDPITYSITGSSAFTIGNSGDIRVSDAATRSETTLPQTSYGLTVQADDPDGGTATTGVTINVGGPTPTPTPTPTPAPTPTPTVGHLPEVRGVMGTPIISRQIVRTPTDDDMAGFHAVNESHRH